MHSYSFIHQQSNPILPSSNQPLPAVSDKKSLPGRKQILNIRGLREGVKLLLLSLSLLGLSAHAATAPALKAVYCPNIHVTGAKTETCNVDLTAKATQNTVIALSTSDPALSVPSTVTIRKAHTTIKFTLTIKAVTAQITPTLTASYNGTSLSFGFVLIPVSTPPPPVVHKVGLTWGEPSSLAVPIANYNVYRRVSGGTFAKIATTSASPIPIPL